MMCRYPDRYQILVEDWKHPAMHLYKAPGHRDLQVPGNCTPLKPLPSDRSSNHPMLLLFEESVPDHSELPCIAGYNLYSDLYWLHCMSRSFCTARKKRLRLYILTITYQ